MAKKSGLIMTKPNPIKKIEKDIAAFQFSVGEASVDLINLVQMEVRKKGFLSAPNSVKNKGRRDQTYKVTPGANLDVKITRSNKNITIIYKFTDKYSRIFGTFEGGFKTIRIQDINGKSKKQKVGQRKVVSNGFRRAVRRWKKLNTFRTEEALRTRSIARI